MHFRSRILSVLFAALAAAALACSGAGAIAPTVESVAPTVIRGSVATATATPGVPATAVQPSATELVPADQATATAGPAATTTVVQIVEPTATAVIVSTAVPTPTPAPTATQTRTPTSTPVPATAVPAVPTPTSVPHIPRTTEFVPLDNPVFVSANSAPARVTGESFVLGIEWNGEARAYPLDMMWWHHIANDTIGGDPVLVTY